VSELKFVLSVSKVLSNERGYSRCPLAGEKRTIWFSRVYATPINATGKFGVMVIVLDFQLKDDTERGSSSIGTKIFLYGKNGAEDDLIPPCSF